MLGKDESLLWMMDSERVQAIMDAAKALKLERLPFKSIKEMEDASALFKKHNEGERISRDSYKQKLKDLKTDKGKKDFINERTGDKYKNTEK